jgi:hypothetical protein
VWLSGLLQITSQTGCPVWESGAWSEMRSTAWFAASADRIRCTTYAAVWIPGPGVPVPAWPGVTDPAGLVPADERPAPGELPGPDGSTATAVTAAATAAAAALAAISGPRRRPGRRCRRAGRTRFPGSAVSWPKSVRMALSRRSSKRLGGGAVFTG